MKIRFQLYTLFGILFCVLAALSFYTFRENVKYLLLVEGLLLVVLCGFLYVLKRIIKPIEQISSGVNVLKDQDFSGRIRYSGIQEVDQMVDVYNRMIENIKAERIFQKEQHFFLNNLIEALPVGLVILDFDNKIKQFNSSAKKLLNLQESHLETLFLDLDFQIRNEILEQELGKAFLYKIGANKYWRVYIDNFKYKGFYQKFMVFEEAGDEILKLQKDAYGKVIRMMAHEVKNSVGAVNSILETLKNFSDESEYFEIAIDRNQKLNVFIDNFAKVARLTEPIKSQFDFSDSVESIYYLMKLKFNKRNVDFSLSLPEQKVYINGSQEQLEQVLINVILNAFEAISDSGQISVVLSENQLKIMDSGSGIQDADKLFTPFYSTKTSGQGIGLTLVREILSAHDFPFDLKSQNGKTSFTIVFS